jgi:uncharacterized protein (TIGR00730 family)
MKSICVYCGANPGFDVRFLALAQRTGALLAREGITLVYGGGAVGLMGEIARAALVEGGRVVGIIPQALMDLELARPDLTQLHVVPDMHTRKAKMAELSDGFIALPGGFGTLDELFEMITWGQLGFHTKPIALLNDNNFYAPLITMVEHMMAHGFVREPHRGLFVSGDTPESALAAMRAWQPIDAKKWLPSTLGKLHKK